MNAMQEIKKITHTKLISSNALLETICNLKQYIYDPNTEKLFQEAREHARKSLNAFNKALEREY